MQKTQTGSAIQFNATDTKKIDGIFSKISQEGPGGIITISRRGNIVYQKAHGLAVAESKVPFSGSTVFDLASCSKQFTAAAILLLADQGRLSLDDKAARFLPELKERSSAKPVFIRHLLNMTSGLADYSSGFSESELRKLKLQDLLAWTAKQSRKFPAGSEFDYNNGNYALLALIVERASKRSYPDFMKAEFFEPLGMKDSFILQGPNKKIRNRAGNYTSDKDGSYKWNRNDTFIYGDGQVMTTPDDFAAWDKALYNFPLLKPASLKKAFTATRLATGKSSDYGFGWSIEKYKKQKLLCHEGNWNGTSTYIGRFPDLGLSIMVLANDDNFGAGEYATKVMDIIFNQEPFACKN